MYLNFSVTIYKQLAYSACDDTHELCTNSASTCGWIPYFFFISSPL